MTDFCLYCNDVHEMMNFGPNFAGGPTLVCSHQLADALEKTMPKGNYDELEATEVE